MISDELTERLRENPFLAGKEIEISSIYFDDPLEKCFLVTDIRSLRKYKVRFSTTEFPKTVKGEYSALKYLKENLIDWIPQVYYFDDTDDILVYEYLEGDSLDKIQYDLSLNEFESIRLQLIKMISQMHSLEGNHFGDLGGDRFADWQSFLHRKLSHHIDNACKINLLSNADRSLILSVLESNLDYNKTVKSSFIHFDLKPGNVIFDRKAGEVRLIDFELCRFGDVNIEYSRFITYYKKQDHIYNSLFLPLAKSFPDLNYPDFIKSKTYQLYNIYNLLAYYTTSYIKHNIVRDYLVAPITNSLKILQSF